MQEKVLLAGPLEQFVPKGLFSVERINTGEVSEGLYPVGCTPFWSSGKA